MAFQNIKFPDIKLKHGISKSILDPVIITGNGAREVRRRPNKWERFVWNYPSRAITEADKHAIYVFLRGVNMGKDSFILRDPVQPTVTLGKLGSRSTNTWYLNVPYSTTVAGTHPIFHPDMTALSFFRNGSPASATFGGVDSNGFPYVTVTGSSSGDNIQMTGDIYHTVRFNGSMAWAIAAMTLPTGGDCTDVVPTVVELGDFSLVEVFE